MSVTAFDAGPILDGLKAFQRATVEHVMRRFHGPDPTDRFLVADETGLGKSMVARGVIARTIQQLEDDDRVERIDVVYVCSNADIAQQNIARLDVTGDPHLPFASRLTLLAKHSRALAAGGGRFTKPVNLVSFTPGTSFDMGWHTGQAEERALLFLLLRDVLDLTGWRRRAALNLLRDQVGSHDRFDGIVGRLERELATGVDPSIQRGFTAAARQGGHIEEFDHLVGSMGRRTEVPGPLRESRRTLIRRMRGELARASVETLEPDLVILDEFQRFRHLLDETSDAGELAHNLFEFKQAKVLLLSATPYKPFTYAEEAADDHHRDFLRTLRFLTDDPSGAKADAIADDLDAYRRAAVSGRPVTELTGRLRDRLLRVMCRTERPATDEGRMTSEHITPAVPGADDLVGYVALRKVADAVDGQMSVDYWKSAPYFINFCDGYQLASRIRDAVASPARPADLLPLLHRTQRLDSDALLRFERLDYGNARLRDLAADTVDAGWWQLLWIPPSLPYLTPSGPYAEPFAADVTKRLVFSSWSATPTAIASLLSYEAERRLAEGSRLTENSASARRSIANRLAYNLDGQRPQSMTTLALFWPMPGLAALGDPLTQTRAGAAPVDPVEVERAVAVQLAVDLPAGDTSRASGSEGWYWAAALRRPDSRPVTDRDELLRALTGQSEADDESEEDNPLGLTAHITQALHANDVQVPTAPPPDLASTVASLAAHSPANIAWRALHRLAHDQSAVTEAGHWSAAAVLASGLRSLFSRLETMLLLDHLYGEETYWRAVLRYCAAGNLQAVLDEYVHHLADAGTVLDDDSLRALAQSAAGAIALRPSRYRAFDPAAVDTPIPLTARFALRYGGRRQNQEDARQPEIRRAFNSPFWPFVLATTSVGQEGIDFHWWSHAVMHWNTPANPVDFEQREGRVHRYAGHAIRRNIAFRHGSEILAAAAGDPWRTAYQLATDETERYGEFAPYWTYPGPARIERHLAPYPLSVDAGRLTELKQDVALYRLTFGQPRQEDMLELLRRNGTAGHAVRVNELRLDLSPPRLL